MRHTSAARFRFRGDPKLARAFITEGRKYLGELNARLAAGKAKSGSRRLKNAAGVIFKVSALGEQPIIEIDVRNVKTDRIGLASLFGFVTKARKFGVVNDPIPVDVTNGENFFGEKAHVILSDSRPNEVDPVWRRRFFDADTYAPTEGEAGTYQSLFADGLLNTGNVDWRDGDEKLAVTWIGAPCRTMGYPGVFQGYAYYNGDLILTLWDELGEDAEIDLERAIQCACLKKIGPHLYLYWIAQPFLFENGTTQLCRAKLRPHPDLNWGLPSAYLCPRIDLVRLADVEVLYTFEETDGHDNPFGGTQGAFNQAATEVRWIFLSFGEDGELHSDEIALDFSGPQDEWEPTVTRRTMLTTTTTTYGPETVQANVQEHRGSDSDWSYSAVYVPDAVSYPHERYDTLIQERFYGVGAGDSVSSPNYRGVVGVAGSASTVTTVDEAVPLAIDFKDNVPVRLWWQPSAATGTSSYTRTFGNDDEFDAHRQTHQESGDLGSGFVHIDMQRAISFYFTENGQYEGSATGGKIFVLVEGAGAPWLTLETASERTFTTASTANSEGAWDIEWDGAPDPTPPHADYIINAATVEEEASYTATATGTITDFALWFLDMRYDHVAYSTQLMEYTRTQTTDIAGTYSSTDPTLWVVFHPTTCPTTVDTSVSGGQDYSYTFVVKFYGDTVSSNTFTQSVDFTDSDSTSGTGGLGARWPQFNTSFYGVSGAITARAPVDDMTTNGPLGAGISKAQSITLRDGLGILSSTDVDLTGTLDLLAQDDYTPTGSVGTGSGEFRDFREIPVTVTRNVTGWWENTEIYTGSVSWIPNAVDSDIRTYAHQTALPRGWGNWIGYRGRWAFSQPWPGSDMSIPTWHHGISPDGDAHDLEYLTGAYPDGPPELYGTMWPLSQCLTAVPAGMTLDQLSEL